MPPNKAPLAVGDRLGCPCALQAGWGPVQAAPGQVPSGCCRQHWRRARGPAAHRDTPAFQPASPGHSLLRLVPARPSPWPSPSDTAEGPRSEPPGANFPGHSQPQSHNGTGDNGAAARMPPGPVSPGARFDGDPVPLSLPRSQPLTCAHRQQQQQDGERHGARPGGPGASRGSAAAALPLAGSPAGIRNWQLRSGRSFIEHLEQVGGDAPPRRRLRAGGVVLPHLARGCHRADGAPEASAPQAGSVALPRLAEAPLAASRCPRAASCGWGHRTRY